MEMPSPSDETLSLYGITRRYCRERLLVEPLQWTSRQLELLRCSFDDASIASPVLQSKITYASNGIKCLKQFFVYKPGFATRESAIRRLIASRDCPLDSMVNLPLSIEGRCVKTLPCSVFFPRSDALEEDSVHYMPPIAAHIEESHIVHMRESVLRPSVRRLSSPVSALYAIKWKRFSPTNHLHDPYVVALLIALAQRQRKAMGQRSDGNASGITVPSKLLLTSKDDDFLHLYSADIPAHLLDMFDLPSVSPPAHPPVSIQITAIPYKPLDTLRSRILAFLLSESHRRMDRKRKFESQDTQPWCPRRKMEDPIMCT